MGESEIILSSSYMVDSLKIMPVADFPDFDNNIQPLLAENDKLRYVDSCKVL